MKTMTAIAITLMLATRTEAAPQAEPQQSSRCIMPKPFCPYGQEPLCVCQDQFSYSCIWMCASAR
jgi:hypothetical protein